MAVAAESSHSWQLHKLRLDATDAVIKHGCFTFLSLFLYSASGNHRHQHIPLDLKNHPRPSQWLKARSKMVRPKLQFLQQLLPKITLHTFLPLNRPVSFGTMGIQRLALQQLRTLQLWNDFPLLASYISVF